MNNAGLFSRTDWRLMTDVNMTGAVTGCMVAIQRMGTSQGRGGRGGTIVNTASLAGLLTGAWETHIEHIYTATKHGIVGLTR